MFAHLIASAGKTLHIVILGVDKWLSIWYNIATDDRDRGRTVIDTNVLQTFSEFKEQLCGFTLEPNSGTLRAVLKHTQNIDPKVTMIDVLHSARYMLGRGWLIEAGWFGRDRLYSVYRGSWAATETWEGG